MWQVTCFNSTRLRRQTRQLRSVSTPTGTAKTRRLLQLSLLVALAGVLHMVEAFLPVPVPVPGLKLGLANIVTLFVVLRFSLREALAVSLLRVILGSLFSGTMLGPSFVMALAGALASCLAMYYASRRWGGVFSPVGISVIGAVVHNGAQMLAAAWLVQTPGLLYYVPYLVLFAAATGLAIGLAGRELLRKVPLA